MPIVYIFFIVLMTLVLSVVLFSEKFCMWTARYWTECAKLYGFEGEIRSTPKAVKFCRIWNLVVFVFMAAGFLIFVFKK